MASATKKTETRGRKPGSKNTKTVNNKASYEEQGNQTITSNKISIMSASKYIDLITQDEESVKNDQAELDNEAAELSLNSAQFETKKAIMEAKRTLATAKKAKPFDPQAVYRAINNLEVQERKLETFNELEAELF